MREQAPSPPTARRSMRLSLSPVGSFVGLGALSLRWPVSHTPLRRVTTVSLNCRADRRDRGAGGPFVLVARAARAVHCR